MAKKKRKGLIALGFLVLTAVFIAFIVALYGALLYFFEGETIKMPDWSWSTFTSIFDDFTGHGKKSKPAESETSTVTEEPAPTAEGFQAKEMTLEILMDGNARAALYEQIKVDGSNAVVVELKGEDGMIYYATGNELAAASGAVSPNAVDLVALAQEIQAAGLKPVARLHTLKDSLAAHVQNDNTYLYQNDPSTNWLDNAPSNGGKRWLNPYRSNARQYIADLAGEVANAGFKTIILSSLQFPDRYDDSSMGLGDDASVGRSEILGQLYSQVKAAVEQAEAAVLAEFPANAYFGENDGIYGGSPKVTGINAVELKIQMDQIDQAGGSAQAAIEKAAGGTLIPYIIGEPGDLTAVYEQQKITSEIRG